MEFRKVLALRGPNIWANFPVLEAWVDLGILKDSSSDELPGLNERLMSWLPTMIEHRCSVGERGGFFERLRRGTYQAHILEHVTLEIQTLAGLTVGFGRARETSEEGVYKVAIEYEEESVARACLEVARELCLAAVYDRPFDVRAEVARLRRMAQRECLGPSTRSIITAAKARGIPMRRLNEGSLVQLGFGARQRRIRAAETDRTSAIGESIAQDKELTRSLLRSVGVPVPHGRPVADADDAWEAAQEIGVPVVVKPQYGNQGRGVVTNLHTREQVIAAYAAARQEESTIMVEKYIAGDDYRILVIGQRVVAAALREPPQVMADGVRTIRQLVEEVNRDPRRGEDHSTSLSPIPLDEIAASVVEEQGYTFESVAPAGTTVLLRRNGNLSTGGTATDVTDLLHPQVAARAVEAARMVGLDIAGIDIVGRDISIPMEEQDAAVLEVNAAPGLRMHLEPSAGNPRPVGEAIVATMFPPGQNGRIPIVAVTGVNGKTTTTRFIAHILRGTGRTVGMTNTDGVFIGHRRIDTGDCSGPQSARNVLLNPDVDLAVFETARGGILRAGLAFDLCDVAVVTNIGEGDHLGLSDIETLEKLAKVKRTIVDVVAPHGTAVLNAGDPLVVEMASYSRGSVVFFSPDPQNPVVVEHRQKGGRAVIIRDHMLVMADGEREVPLVSLDRVPLTHGGRIAFQVENALAAVGAAWSLGMPREVICDGLESFGADPQSVPGRFNLFDIAGTTVVIDYGHNVSSLKAMLETLAQFPHKDRSVVYSAAGDRRDCDMIQQGELLGKSFQRVILYEDHYARGRQAGEITALFRQGTLAVNPGAEIHEVHGALKATDLILDLVKPGELLLLQADVVDETVDYILQHVAKLKLIRPISLNEALGIPTPVPTPVEAPTSAVKSLTS